MGLNREERKLLHQKSKQPTFGNGKPDSNQGNEGDIAYRQVEDSGLVQYVKQNGSWVAVGSQGDMPKTRDVTRTPSGGGGGVGSHNHGEFIKKDGSVAYTGNQSFGTNNITNVGTLDVDGATTLDQVTIDTTDGPFAVSGANSISLTSTGSNDINISSGHTLDVGTPIMELDVGRTYTANIGLQYILNGSDTMVTTGSDNMTIQATGTAANFLLLKNTNNHASSFTGLHLKTDSGGASSAYNRILIECDNIAAKGADYGVDIRSENNIRIRAENANNGNATGLLMRATGPIDIGVASSITPHTSNNRVKVHGIFETGTLWRDSNAPIVMDKGTIEAGSSLGSDTTGEYTKFEAIDTQKLMRNFTYTHKTLNVTNGTTVTLLASASLENTVGTTYRVIVGAYTGSNELINSVYAIRLNSGTYHLADIAKATDFGSGSDFGTIAVVTGVGITWNNNTGSTVHVYATIQRIAESSDYP
tara:strand:+ start:1203 stop:2627 length:1425 start_codon:yes stop_codon:yes gene_type:complete